MSSVCYFYILKYNNSRYFGHTNNLKRRLNEHLKGRVHSTSHSGPIKLVYYEEFKSRSEAFQREMHFKEGRTRRETIERIINSFPMTKCQGFLPAGRQVIRRRLRL